MAEYVILIIDDTVNVFELDPKWERDFNNVSEVVSSDEGTDYLFPVDSVTHFLSLVFKVLSSWCLCDEFKLYSVNFKRRNNRIYVWCLF